MCLLISKFDHNSDCNLSGGVAMTVVRYINNELCEVGKLPPMEVENPALIQIIRDVQLKAIEKSENMKENMGKS